jgi:hypothetical protein
MIFFDRRSGTVTLSSGKVLSRSTWSGHGSAHNDPAREQQKGIGPLPAGDYDLGPLQAHHGHLGPDVMALTARPGTQTYGRGDFFWHGDHPNDTDWSASDGCMISDHAVRIAANQETDRVVRVI